MSETIIEVISDEPIVEVVVEEPIIEVVSEGLQGAPGRDGVLLLDNGADVPPGTPYGTIIYEKAE